MRRQLGLTVIAHRWSFPTGLLASVPATPPPPATRLWEECLFSFFEHSLNVLVHSFFRQNVDSVSLNLVTRFSLFLSSSPFLPFNNLSCQQAARPLQVSVSTSHSSTCRSHWSPWLQTWRFDSDQVSVWLHLLVPLARQRLACSTFCGSEGLRVRPARARTLAGASAGFCSLQTFS